MEEDFEKTATLDSKHLYYHVRKQVDCLEKHFQYLLTSLLKTLDIDEILDSLSFLKLE